METVSDKIPLGLPYKGSKRFLAKRIVEAMPAGGRFLDACCGGGAVTVAAALSGKWDSVTGNDKDKAIVTLLNAVLVDRGQIDYEHPQACTRADFFASLERIRQGDFSAQDCVNAVCCSFGNNCKDYLYGSGIEPLKLQAERMLTARTLHERRMNYKKFIKQLQRLESLQSLQRLESLERLQRLERLESLERLQSLERLERLESGDIFEIDYSKFDCVYFDIPYKGTSGYVSGGFDHDRFYRLFASLGIPAFLSEYDSPFTEVASFDHNSRLCAKKSFHVTEKLFFNGTAKDYEDLMGKS